MEIQKYQAQIQVSGRIPSEIMPKNEEQALTVLQTMPKEYYKTLAVRNFDDVFNGVSPSLATCRRQFGENGLIATQAIMTIIIKDLISSFNVGQTMNDEQVADLINEIIDCYYWLKIEDFRFCFNNAKRGVYDKAVFRLDANVILTWLDKYTSDRLNAAESTQISQHTANKFSDNLPKIDYSKFKNI